MDKTDKDLNVILIAWIKLALGDSAFKVIVGNDKGKEPSGSFASILVMSSASIGMGASDTASHTDPNLLYLAGTSLREVDYSINFYRDDAHENMRQLMHFPNTNASQEFLFDKEVSLFVPDTYRNLDDLESDGYIKRAQMDLRLHSAIVYVETVNAIDEVSLSIES